MVKCSADFKMSPRQVSTTRTWRVLHSPSTLGNCYQMAITQCLIEAQGVSFPPQSFGAGGTTSCAKFDYSHVDYWVPFFISKQTAVSIKQQLNQNCFLVPKDLFFLNDNMFLCEGVERWPCQPHHEGFKNKATAGNRKQELPAHLPHHFVAFT